MYEQQLIGFNCLGEQIPCLTEHQQKCPDSPLRVSTLNQGVISYKENVTTREVQMCNVMSAKIAFYGLLATAEIKFHPNLRFLNSHFSFCYQMFKRWVTFGHFAIIFRFPF